MANENQPLKTEKNEAPQSGFSWGERAEMALIGAAGYTVGTGVAKGIGELAKRAIGRKVADEGVRQAAAFGRRLTGLFSR
jgi:hypothetical protein